jgi:Spy/CpxP family protein refolding chaperone
MRVQRLMVLMGLAMMLAAGCVQAQMGPPPGGSGPRGEMGPPRGGPPGQWWQNPQIAKQLALTGDQTNAIDGILRENRQRLFDLSTAVQREDFAMQGLMDADQPDEGKILAQVDKLAGARAELEKANARMLLAMRRVLSADQWRKLQEYNHVHPPQRHGPPPGEE